MNPKVIEALGALLGSVDKLARQSNAFGTNAESSWENAKQQAIRGSIGQRLPGSRNLFRRNIHSGVKHFSTGRYKRGLGLGSRWATSGAASTSIVMGQPGLQDMLRGPLKNNAAPGSVGLLSRPQNESVNSCNPPEDDAAPPAAQISGTTAESESSGDFAALLLELLAAINRNTDAVEKQRDAKADLSGWIEKAAAIGQEAAKRADSRLERMRHSELPANTDKTSPYNR